MTADEIIRDILDREGWPTVSNLVSDRGGLTKGGVTFKTYNAWLVSKGNDPLTEGEFAALSLRDAETFYNDAFVLPFEYLNGPSPEEQMVRITAIDWGVMSGHAAPVRALQRSLAALGFDVGRIDGADGMKTLEAWAKAANAGAAHAVFAKMSEARIDAHITSAFDVWVRDFLVRHPESQLHNLHGWMRRAIRIATQ